MHSRSLPRVELTETSAQLTCPFNGLFAVLQTLVFIFFFLLHLILQNISCRDGINNDDANSPKVKLRRTLSKPTPSAAGNDDGVTRPKVLTRPRTVHKIDDGADKPGASKPIVNNTPLVKPVVANKSPPKTQSVII